MNKHLKYLTYMVRHKWYVLVAGLSILGHLRREGQLRVGPWLVLRVLCRLVVHDASKFRPSEWFPYAEFFYGTRMRGPPEDDITGVASDFNYAWLAHQRRNDHHWQHWMLIQDDGPQVAMCAPMSAVIEMCANWAGAGRAITGRWDVQGWYSRNMDKIGLSCTGRAQVFMCLGAFPVEGK